MARQLLAACSLLVALSNAQTSTETPAADEDGKYTISAEGIRAQFIPYGASLSNLFINDTSGTERDIVLGFDNATFYGEDTVHPHYGGVPGESAATLR